MRSTKRSYVAVALLAAVAAGVRAEGPKVSGFVDVGYNYNLNGQRTNELRSFDANSNSITLQNAEIDIEGKLENGVGYRVDMMYGYDASNVNATEDFGPTEVNQATQTVKATNVQFNLQQAFMTFPCPITGAAISVGKFVTPFGYEVVEAKDNSNISRGLLFGYTVPFSHTGVKADKGFVDGKFTASVGLVNGWDNMKDNNSGKSGILQLGTTVLPKTSILIGGAYGPEQAPENTQDSDPGNDYATQGNGRSLLDAIVKVTPIDKLTLVANYDWGVEEKGALESSKESDDTANWSGLGLHAIYSLTDMLSGAFRYEYLDDEGARVALDKNGDSKVDSADVESRILKSYTATLQAKKDDVLYRLEYRVDHSQDYDFVSDKGERNRKSQSTIGAQVIVAF